MRQMKARQARESFQEENRRADEMEWKNQGSEQGSLSLETHLQSPPSYRAHAGDNMVHVSACLKEQLMRPFGTKTELFW